MTGVRGSSEGGLTLFVDEVEVSRWAPDPVRRQNEQDLVKKQSRCAWTHELPPDLPAHVREVQAEALKPDYLQKLSGRGFERHVEVTRLCLDRCIACCGCLTVVDKGKTLECCSGGKGAETRR